MKTIKSKFYKSNNCIVCTLDQSDFDVESFAVTLYKKADQFDLRKAVFDISSFETVISSDIKQLSNLVSFFKLFNIDCIVCGFSPDCIVSLVHFIDNIPFETALDIESALDAYSSR